MGAVMTLGIRSTKIGSNLRSTAAHRGFYVKNRHDPQ